MTSPNRFDLLNPTFRCDPRDIVRNPNMAVQEKRSLLASWASDARAVPNHPALRQLDKGGLVTIDDVLAALKALDDIEDGADRYDRGAVPIRRGHWTRLGRLWRRGRDDDDDPPPAPASIRPYQPVSGGSLAAAA
jgi:hypothetical protein